VESWWRVKLADDRSYPTLRMTLANPSEALATNDAMMKLPL
jgi:hypothetical protein